MAIPASENFLRRAARSAGVLVSFRCASLRAMCLMPVRWQTAMVSSTESMRVEYEASPIIRPWNSGPGFRATSAGTSVSAAGAKDDTSTAPASWIASRRSILFIRFIGATLQVFRQYHRPEFLFYPGGEALHEKVSGND